MLQLEHGLWDFHSLFLQFDCDLVRLRDEFFSTRKDEHFDTSIENPWLDNEG